MVVQALHYKKVKLVQQKICAILATIWGKNLLFSYYLFYLKQLPFLLGYLSSFLFELFLLQKIFAYHPLESDLLHFKLILQVLFWQFLDIYAFQYSESRGKSFLSSNLELYKMKKFVDFFQSMSQKSSDGISLNHFILLLE